MQTNLTVREVMALEPSLTYHGFRAYGAHGPFGTLDHAQELEWFDQHRNEMFTDYAEQEFQRAVQWLIRQPRTKHPNPRAGTSYRLKHLAEADMGRYISNGMFIAAAIALGFEYVRAVDVSVTAVNAYISIAKQLVRPETDALLAVVDGL